MKSYKVVLCIQIVENRYTLSFNPIALHDMVVRYNGSSYTLSFNPIALHDMVVRYNGSNDNFSVFNTNNFLFVLNWTRRVKVAKSCTLRQIVENCLNLSYFNQISDICKSLLNITDLNRSFFCLLRRVSIQTASI